MDDKVTTINAGKAAKPAGGNKARIQVLRVDREEVFSRQAGIAGLCFSGISVRAQVRLAKRDLCLTFFYPYFPKRLGALVYRVAESVTLKRPQPRDVKKVELKAV